MPGALLYSISAVPLIEGFPTIVKSKKEMLKVQNLLPDVEYEFTLVTSVNFGRTDPSIQKQRTVISPPVLNLEASRSSWFEVSWEDNPACEEYQVQIKPSSGQIFPSRNMVKVTNARPASDYEISVACSVRKGLNYSEKNR